MINSDSIAAIYELKGRRKIARPVAATPKGPFVVRLLCFSNFGRTWIESSANRENYELERLENIGTTNTTKPFNHFFIFMNCNF